MSGRVILTIYYFIIFFYNLQLKVDFYHFFNSMTPSVAHLSRLKTDLYNVPT